MPIRDPSVNYMPRIPPVWLWQKMRLYNEERDFLHPPPTHARRNSAQLLVQSAYHLAGTNTAVSISALLPLAQMPLYRITRARRRPHCPTPGLLAILGLPVRAPITLVLRRHPKSNSGICANQGVRCLIHLSRNPCSCNRK